MTVRRYIQVTGTGAFIAFIIYLYFEISTNVTGGWKIIFLLLFLVFSIMALIDAMRGGLKDKPIIGKVKIGKKVIKK